MGDDQKLTDLKKACADMMLNTVKEAATRIMASERKALRLELERKHCKEEALQMLTRLKQMMDSKVTEAEMASRAQQNKIEELEAQLQEAEDIVKDLREELSAVQAELERAVTEKEVKLMVHANEALERDVCTNPDYVSLPPPKEQPNTDRDKSNKGHILSNPLFPSWKSYINDQDLPSIILRSKGPKLYRSGCTHRIHAYERTPLGRELSLPEEPNHIRADEEGKRSRKGPSLGDERKKSRKRAGPNKKKRTSCENQLCDQVKENDNSYLTTARPATRFIRENSEENINAKMGKPLIDVSDIQRRLREVLFMKCGKPELLPSSETQIDPTESKSVVLGGVPVQPSSRVIKYTFQRKRKRATLKTESKTETEKVNIIEESTEKETNKVNSTEEPTEEENEKVNSKEESIQEETQLEQVAQQLMALSEKRKKGQ